MALSAAAAACNTGPAKPAALGGSAEACRHCRMIVSNPRFAAQIAAPGEDPVFFDDIGCLSTYLHSAAARPAGSVAYVADHRTGEWVPAAVAVFTVVPSLETPMGSHVVAHVTAASRDADPSTPGGRAVPLSALFPPDISEGRR
ncbi:MAG: nitrous oxide reductase accessory protein NosL [Acidobacteriota bacterium]